MQFGKTLTEVCLTRVFTKMRAIYRFYWELCIEILGSADSNTGLIDASEISQDLFEIEFNRI